MFTQEKGIGNKPIPVAFFIPNFLNKSKAAMQGAEGGFISGSEVLRVLC
jgi:hypothetical protein